MKQLTQAQAAEFTAIKAQATSLGITFHHRANTKTVTGLINAHLANQVTAEGVTPDTTPEKVVEVKGPLTAAEYAVHIAKTAKLRATRLIRIRLTCMNPLKKNWPGETFSTGSSKLGTIKKHVPFNGLPYHVPQIIYDMIKDRRCSSFYDVPDGRGGVKRASRLVPEFSVEVLDPLTPAELDDLRHSQAMAKNGL